VSVCEVKGSVFQARLHFERRACGVSRGRGLVSRGRGLVTRGRGLVRRGRGLVSRGNIEAEV
jgi:hypothetical protein